MYKGLDRVCSNIKGAIGVSLSLCMIAKNEEENIGRALESVKDIVDEMIVVDTGSTDSTVKIAESYGAKVYYYEWNNNFSDAKNFALEKAAGDWILLMDADDELVREDKQKLLDLLKNADYDVYFMDTLSFVGDRPGNDIVMNINVRLIRNGKGIKFSGAIHEQIGPGSGGTVEDLKMRSERIRFNHYGYLNKNVVDKNKRRRNIEILEKELENDNNNGFLLFGMGNEYFALHNFEKALEYYNKAYENFKPDLGYSPKLIIRMVMTLHELKKYDEELDMIEKGLKYFPDFTDLEYLRACLFHRLGRYTLAIKSLEKCIYLGEPKSYLNFIVGVGTFKPYHALAEIYFDMGDYQEAYNCCIKCLKIKPDFYPCFEKIAQIYFKADDRNKEMDYIKRQLESLFNGNLDGPAYLTLGDVFFSHGRYDIAYDYIIKAGEFLEETETISFYKDMCLFHMRNYREALKYFKKVKSGEFYEKALYKMVMCEVFENKMNAAENLLNKAKEFTNDRVRHVYKTFKSLVEGKMCKTISSDRVESTVYLNIICDLLNTLLKVSEFEIFEKSLQLLNLIESDEVLLRLAKIYYVNGFQEMAFKEFIRSIKVFDKIDIEGLDMMKKIVLKV